MKFETMKFETKSEREFWEKVYLATLHQIGEVGQANPALSSRVLADIADFAVLARRERDGDL